jgi:transcriptional regulator with XRE-family HTH domain
MKVGPYKHFGAWLRAARLSKGWSGEKLALEIGASQGNVSMYERGIRRPQASRISQIAQVLGADLRQAMEAFLADSGVTSDAGTTSDFGATQDTVPQRATETMGTSPLDETLLHEALRAYSGNNPALSAAAQKYREVLHGVTTRH